MNFRMTLGGRHKDEHHHEDESRRYAEGYNLGYNMAMDEMRRRTRSFHPHEEWEDRRRRTRGFLPDEEWERHNPHNDVHWPIGFAHDYPPEGRRRRSRGEDDSRIEMLMDMVSAMKAEHDYKRGVASSVEKLDPRMAALFETAAGVLDNPPSTWDAYMKREDYLGIAKMEGKELLTALEAHKPVKDIRKELSHTLAALMMLATK